MRRCTMLLALALGSITVGLSTASAASAAAQHTIVVPSPLAPGLDQGTGAVFPTPSHWIVLVDQCYPCEAQTGTHREWVAESNDSGHSWTVRRTTMPLVVSSSVPPMVFASGQDAWAYGGWVSHDGGLEWAKASAPVPLLDADVEVGAGRVWTLVSSVFGAGASKVLTGTVTGNELTPTKGQPFPTGYDPGTVIAATTSTAYVQANGPSGTVIDVTRDGGKTWQKIAPPCGSNQAGEVNAPAATLTAFSAELLSMACTTKNLHPAKITHSVSFSTNGGRTWTKIPTASSEIIRAESVSSTIGWGTNGAGAILRTTDSGHAWRTVWPGNSQGSPVGTLENLAASGPADAFGTFAITTSKGTYFLLRATTDAGATWSAVAAFTVP